ncbi:hypothetical protein GC167_04720 [bacterium]|nr:hypothetical protein [bacterium]
MPTESYNEREQGASLEIRRQDDAPLAPEAKTPFEGPSRISNEEGEMDIRDLKPVEWPPRIIDSFTSGSRFTAEELQRFGRR